MIISPKLRRSLAQEKAIARDVAGRRTAGSGNQPGNKGDIREEKWLIEAKQTKSSRYSLTLLTWRTIWKYAVRASKEPVIVVEMAGVKLAVIDYNAWLAMKDRI